MSWDPEALLHLEQVRARIDTAGVIDYLHEVARDLWRANQERYDEALYDDSGTLGYLTSKNAANRIHAELRGPQGRLAPKATAITDTQSVVIKVGNLSVRLVKAPVERGTDPKALGSFRWEVREGRALSAGRNAAAYRAPITIPDIEPFFEIDVDDQRIEDCTDFFVAWGGDDRGRTRGWLGIPTLGPSPWLAVIDIWSDGDADERRDVDPIEPDGPDFSAIEPPPAAPTLKRGLGAGAKP